MKEIDYLAFKKLLHIDDDDHWLGGDSPFLYRIAGGAVRAVPFGFRVDQGSLAPVRPLVRVSNYNPACFESLSGEADELEMYNPSGAADAVLFQFPATVEVVSDFLTRADLWWMVDKVLLQEHGLCDLLDTCQGTGNEVEPNASPVCSEPDLTSQEDDESLCQPSDDHSVVEPLPDPEDDSWCKDREMVLNERRTRAIVWLLHDKEYERMEIKRGEKKEIEELCKHFFEDLFQSSTAFSQAWKLGSKRQWWRVEDYNKFMRNRAR